MSRPAAAAPLPVLFEANRGQAPADVDFVARGSGYSLMVRGGGAELCLKGGARIRARHIGARASRAEALDPLTATAAHLRGRNRVTGIPTFGRVRYRDVYPGTDVVYYSRGREIEYDFVLAPGASPASIRIAYDGARQVHVDHSGNLVLRTAGGTLRQHRPVAYQETGGTRRAVPVHYAVRRNVVHFVVGRYDPSRTLVIDPTLEWSSCFGSRQDDEGQAVTTDAAGNIYIAGSTVSLLGDQDGFVAKFDARASTLIYVTTIGGEDSDLLFAIAVDAAGCAWVAGQTDSQDWPVTADAVQDRRSNGWDVVLARLDPRGRTLEYSTYYGGADDDLAFGLALDGSGNVFVAGATRSPDFPTASGAYQARIAGQLDAYLVKFDSTGRTRFSTLLGGANNDLAYAVALDPTGNVYLTGQTASASFPTSGSVVQSRYGGGTDAFVASFDNNGNLRWSTYLGGSREDIGRSIAVDAAGSVRVAGSTTSADFPVLNSIQDSARGGLDGFVARLDPGGSRLLFSTYLGGAKNDELFGIALDASGTAYFTGTSNSADFPVSRDASQAALRTGADAVFGALDPAGTLLYATYLGGRGNDSGRGVAANGGAVIILGATASSDFPTTAGAIGTRYGGGAFDAFLACFTFPAPQAPGVPAGSASPR